MGTRGRALPGGSNLGPLACRSQPCAWHLAGRTTLPWHYGVSRPPGVPRLRGTNRHGRALRLGRCPDLRPDAACPAQAPGDRVGPPPGAYHPPGPLPPLPAKVTAANLLPYICRLALSDARQHWRVGVAVALLIWSARAGVSVRGRGRRRAPTGNECMRRRCMDAREPTFVIVHVLPLDTTPHRLPRPLSTPRSTADSSKVAGLQGPLMFKRAVDHLAGGTTASAVRAASIALLLSNGARVLSNLTREAQTPIITPISQARARGTPAVSRPNARPLPGLGVCLAGMGRQPSAARPIPTHDQSPPPSRPRAESHTGDCLQRAVSRTRPGPPVPPESQGPFDSGDSCVWAFLGGRGRGASDCTGIKAPGTRGDMGQVGARQRAVPGMGPLSRRLNPALGPG